MNKIRKMVLFFILFGVWYSTLAENLKCEPSNPLLERRLSEAVGRLGPQRRSPEEEQEILITLEESVKARCHKAAVILAEIKMIAFLDPKHVHKNLQRDKVENAVYELLLEANMLDEGWFEMGMLLSDRNGLYFDLARAKAALERAKTQGDERAGEFMERFLPNR